MFKQRFNRVSTLISLFLVSVLVVFANDPLPRGEDSVDVPTIGSEVCAHNLFQSNMVLQRDKPIRIWGWAGTEEEVKVSFAGKEQSVKAGKDHSFQPADVDYLVVGQEDRGRPRKDIQVWVLTSPHVSKPVHFRYAWARSPMANIPVHHNTDIPLVTQRSDDWGLYEAPVNFGDEGGRTAMDELRSTLRMEDIRRRLKEAEMNIEENQDKYDKEMESWKQKYAQQE